MTWIFTLIAVFVVSLMGFAGAVTLPFNEKAMKKLVFLLVSFSAGALLGDAFIHLLPEATEKAGFTLGISLSLLSGIVLFFVLEKLIFWRHCHVAISPEHPHPFAWMNLIGDGLHNSIDGMVIAASFIAGPYVGLATTLAVILHEIPQEIGNYAVCVHGGFGRVNALFLNFGVQLTSFLGALVILVLNFQVADLTAYLLPFTAGGFIYIAGTDLIPELKKETALKDTLVQLLSILAGLALMLAILFFER